MSGDIADLMRTPSTMTQQNFLPVRECQNLLHHQETPGFGGVDEEQKKVHLEKMFSDRQTIPQVQVHKIISRMLGDNYNYKSTS
jgi:hypothetical protein